MSVEQKTKHFLLLDALRGLAAMCVLVGHLGMKFKVKHAIYHSYLAVPFFFVLSGFVIARAYEGKFQSGLGLSKFAKIRMHRLYPMLILSILISLVSEGGGPNVLFVQIISSLLLVPLLMLSSTFPMNGPLWSLSLEFWGNILHRWIYARLTTPLLIGVAVVFAAMLSATSWRFGGGYAGDSYASWFAGPVLFLTTYSIGVVMWRAGLGVKPKGINPLWSICLLLFILAVPQPLNTHANAIRDWFCIVVGCPAVVVLGLHSRVHYEALLRWLGNVSYPIYVLNWPLMNLLQSNKVVSFSEPDRYLMLSGFFIFVCVASTFAYHVVDVPVRRWLSRRSESGRLRPSVVAA